MRNTAMISDVTNGGSLLECLQALANRLADEIDACKAGNVDDAKVLPGLARQYRETVIKIDALESGMDDDDEIATIILRNRQSNSH